MCTQVEDSIRKELTPSGIEVQSQRYHTEEDPRNVQDLFVSSKIAMIIAICVLFGVN